MRIELTGKGDWKSVPDWLEALPVVTVIHMPHSGETPDSEACDLRIHLLTDVEDDTVASQCNEIAARSQPVAVLTPDTLSARQAVALMKAGALDVLPEPWEQVALENLVKLVQQQPAPLPADPSVQQRLAALIDTSPNLFVMLDNNERIILTNRALKDFFGLDPEQVRGWSFDRFIEETASRFEDPQAYRDMIRQNSALDGHTSGGDVLELVKTGITKKHPTEQQITCVPTAIAAGDSEQQGVVWSFVDITEIRRSTELLRTMVEFSPIPTLVSRLEDGYILFANEPLAKLMDIDPDDVVGHMAPDFYANEGDRDEVKRILAEKGGVRNHEVQLRRSDGGTLWMIFNLVTADLAGEKVIIGSFFNIEERKRAEEELRWERNFVNAVVDTAAALIVVMEEDGSIIRFNRFCEQVSGYTADELVGNEFFELLLPEDERDLVRARFEEIAAGKVPNYGENHWITKSGDTRLISWSNTLVNDPKNNQSFVVAIGIDITEARKSEERLRLYHRIFMAADDGIMITDACGKLLEMNPAQRARLDRLGIEDDMHESMDIASNKAMHKALKTDGEFNGEVRFHTKTGDDLIVDLSVFPIHDDDGALQYYVGMGRDMTQRRKDQETLAIRLRYEIGLAGCSHTLLDTGDPADVLPRAIRHLLRGANVHRVAVYDVTGEAEGNLKATVGCAVTAPGVKDACCDRTLELSRPENEAWRRTFKANLAVVVQERDAGRVVNTDKDPHTPKSVLLLPVFVNDQWKGLLRFDDPQRPRTWDDEEVRILKTAAQMVGGYLSRRQAVEALRVSEERFRSLVENIKDVIFSTDAEGRLTYLSPQFESITGYRVADYIGRPASELITDSEARQVHTEWLESGAMQSEEEAFEFWMETAGGERKWFVTHSSTICDAEGNVIEIIGAAHEITALKKMMEELEQANRHLRETQGQLVQSEKMASLGMLVAGIAHEINTPIGAVSSMHNTLVLALGKLNDALEEVKTQDDKLAQTIRTMMRVIDDANKVIKNGTQRVTAIVRRLRSFARLDEAALKDCDLHEGLEDTLTLVHHEIKHTITVNREYGELPILACYPGRMNQVFLNIIINARQAMREKGEITIRTWTEGKKAFIAFTDTGGGIPKENLEKIFDPGFTTKGVGIGTGLGLSICYRIMQDHHGDIRVESEVGKGTTFTLMLPTNLDEILENT